MQGGMRCGMQGAKYCVPTRKHLSSFVTVGAEYFPPDDTHDTILYLRD